MKIDLPLENWLDFFKLLPREQLAALLPHIGDGNKKAKNRPIADRQFVSFVQCYLHECGNVTLDWVSIKSSSKGPVFVNNAGRKLLLAEVPSMPSNIRSFKQITINYYDQSVLGFLQEFRHMLTNVNITLYCNLRKFDAMSKMMTQLLPSITSIESLKPDNYYDHNAALFQKELSGILASTRILLACHFGHGYDDVYRHWLHIPRDDSKPRIMLANNVTISMNGIYPILPFIENIKKDFLDANQAVSFFACIMGNHDGANIQSIPLANDKTQEKLVIQKGIDPLHLEYVMISRYPMGATEECIEDMRTIVERTEWIWICKQERKVVLNI